MSVFEKSNIIGVPILSSDKGIKIKKENIQIGEKYDNQCNFLC